MLIAQHKDPTNVMRTTSGEANPANDIMMTSAVMTEPAGATMLAPNAITRADPTIPWASPPASSLLALMPQPPGTGAHSIRCKLASLLVTYLLSLDLTQGFR